ncbi:uncharacterized protein LOC132637926 [Lycium barbarum]|uniref:uncharacterized protein LOC132637926 n=1 Tax=Lycium barbarum TaxID=112863 RepID=UPI00293E958D|nr:uncharacterized protein LOC132637926 [Lycium barbarum]
MPANRKYTKKAKATSQGATAEETREETVPTQTAALIAPTVTPPIDSDGDNRSAGPTPSTASAPVSKFRKDNRQQNFRWSGSQSQASVTQSNFTNPICAKCGKRHPVECRSGSNICYGCGQPGHVQRNFPSVRQGTGGNRTHSVNSSVPHNKQTQAGRVPARSGNTSGGPNRLYTLTGRQDIDNRTDVVTGGLGGGGGGRGGGGGGGSNDGFGASFGFGEGHGLGVNGGFGQIVGGIVDVGSGGGGFGGGGGGSDG